MAFTLMFIKRLMMTVVKLWVSDVTDMVDITSMALRLYCLATKRDEGCLSLPAISGVWLVH